MLEGYSCREISGFNNVSQSTVRRVIKYWLSSSPQVIPNYSDINHIICDGTFLKRNSSIYAIMNATNREIIKAEYGVKENGKHLLEFYTELKKQGLSPLTATVDGSPQQAKYLKEVWPEILIQRCVIHVQRQGLSWCRRSPKRTEAKHLRELFLQVCLIQTPKEVELFIQSVSLWEEKYGRNVAISPNRGKVFSDIIRARSMLLKALPYMFHYILNPAIPKSTNAIEGYFSRMKQIYRLHRGLSVANRKNYFNWYFFLKPY